MTTINYHQIKTMSPEDEQRFISEATASTNYTVEQVSGALNAIKNFPIVLYDTQILNRIVDLFILKYAETKVDFVIINIDAIDDLAAIECPIDDNNDEYMVITKESIGKILAECANVDMGSYNGSQNSAADYINAIVNFHSEAKDIIDYLFSIKLFNDLKITPNPKIVQIDEANSRFSSAIWFDKIKEQCIILAGCGGIGSFVGFLLSRMNPDRILLYDNDTLETANLSGQFFTRSDIGHKKVYALTNLCNKFNDRNRVYMTGIAQKYTKDSSTAPVMICGFDNMAARKVFYNSWKRSLQGLADKKDRLFIDGRLAAESLQVFCIRGDNDFCMKKYEEKYLFSDEEADATVCSYKQTTYMANMIGSIIANLFVNFTANLVVEDLRDLPFLTTYDGDTMTFKTYQE